MKKIAFYALIPALSALDQLSKWFISEHFIREGEPVKLLSWLMNAPERLDYRQIEVLPFFNLVMVWNRGISFGLFNNETDYGQIVLIALSLIVAVWFTVWLKKTQSQMQRAGLALVVGGAIGNMIDRMRFGAVMDFLDFHVAGYHWPAFNIADSCIVIGVAVLMIQALFFEKMLHEGR